MSKQQSMDSLRLLMFLSMSNLIVGSTIREKLTCPQVFSKSKAECGHRVSECWSPGQLDTDCDNGNNICCFDGCVNTCLKEKCVIITEVRYENVTKKMCRKEPRGPVCKKQYLEDCHNSCHTVDDIIPIDVETEKCSLVNEQVCNDVFKEVCDFKEETDGQCPITPAFSDDQCSGQAPSDCWSPGSADVDCPNNGLCCFNGCFNRCFNNCQTVVRDVCVENWVEECKDKFERECRDVQMTIDVPVSKTVCVRSKKSCFSMASADESLNMVDVEKCVEETELCNDEISTKQEDIIFNKCLIVPKKECISVPRESCKTISEEVCKKCELRTITEKECLEKPKTVCTKHTTTVEKIVPEEICSKLCVPRIIETCFPAEPETVCQDIVKLMSYKVPVMKCT